LFQGKARRLLTARKGYGKARALNRAVPLNRGAVMPIKHFSPDQGQSCQGRSIEGFFMVKPEWGAKHSCPKCGTRFYDLGKDDPVACIDCGNQWYPEPVLKTKQPIPFEEIEKKKKEEEEVDLEDEDLDIDDDDVSPDNDVDLGGDDDLGVRTDDGEGDDT
jgi:uncharacterized protein (TIGR02300 family)